MTTDEWKQANAEALARGDVIDVEGHEEVGTVAGLAPIRPGDALVRPAASVHDVENAFRDYVALCDRLLDDDDVQHIGGRSFRKKSAWRKLAVAFGVSCEVRERVYERDDSGRIIRAEIVVRATAPNGRFMDGLGICDSTERKFSKPQHDIPATAMTRATNRACSDLFGMGEVSAEEMAHDDDRPARPQSTPRARDRQESRSVAPRATENADADLVATEAFVEALRALPPSYRDAFKEWRRAEGLAWPILKADAPKVAVKVGELVAAASDEPF